MKEEIKLAMSGAAKIRYISNSVEYNIISIKNAIQASNAIKTIAKNLANLTGFGLYQIRVYNGATLLVSKSITKDVIGVGENIVEAQALFTETDFSGSFTKLTLVAEGGLEFSIIDGLTLSKTNSEQIEITWELTITI